MTLDAHVRGESAIGEVDGRVEEVLDGRLSGWAWFVASPTDHVTVRIIVDGAEVGSTVASLVRTDLAAAGIGAGDHGFEFTLPAGLAVAGLHILRVLVEERAAGLSAAAEFSCVTKRTDTPWYGVAFAVTEDTDPIASAPPLNGGTAAVATSTPPLADIGAGLLIGRGGWLFDEARVLASRHRDSAAVRVRDAELAARAIEQLAQRVSEAGALLVPALVPGKEDVYRHLLPAGLAADMPPRSDEALLRVLVEHPRLEPLDLLPALDAGARRHSVFASDSDALSSWGAFCVYRAIIKRAMATCPGISAPLGMDAVSVSTMPGSAPQRPVSAFTGSTVVRCEVGSLPAAPRIVIEPSAPAGVRETPPEDLARIADGSEVIGWEQPQRSDLPRAFVVGSITSGSVAHWSAAHFRFLLLIPHRAAIVDLLPLERPDLVIFLVDADYPSAGARSHELAEVLLASP